MRSAMELANEIVSDRIWLNRCNAKKIRQVTPVADVIQIRKTAAICPRAFVVPLDRNQSTKKISRRSVIISL